MRIPAVCVLVSGLFGVAGCSVHPLQDDVTRKSTYDIVQQIRCEARRAIVENPVHIRAAAIAYEFEFDVTETNNLSAGATLTHPYAGGGLLGLPFTAGMDRTRNSFRNFKIADSFSEARAAECSREALQKNWVYPIAGDVGVYEVVRTFIRLHSSERPEGGEVFTFSDNLSFTTMLNGGSTPTLTLNPVTGRTRLTSANGNLALNRNDIHKVKIALAGGPSFSPARSGLPRNVLGLQRNAMPAASNTVSLTLLQAEASAKGRALLELDRQRLLELQRDKDVIVIP